MSESDHWSGRFIHFDTQARALHDRAYALISVGLTGLVTIAGISVAYAKFEILLTIPFAVVVLWATGLRMLHEQFFLGLYRDEAEKQIALMRGGTARLGTWNRFAGRHIRFGWPNYALFAVLVITTIGLMVASLLIAAWELPNQRGWVVAAAVGSGFAITAIAMAWAKGSKMIADGYAQLDDDASGSELA